MVGGGRICKETGTDAIKLNLRHFLYSGSKRGDVVFIAFCKIFSTKCMIYLQFGYALIRNEGDLLGNDRM